jgi:hypothetical protein
MGVKVLRNFEEKTGGNTTGNGIFGQDTIQNLLIVWAVKKTVHTDTEDNESTIYRKEAYGKPKNRMVQSVLETSR